MLVWLHVVRCDASEMLNRIFNICSFHYLFFQQLRIMSGNDSIHQIKHPLCFSLTISYANGCFIPQEIFLAELYWINLVWVLLCYMLYPVILYISIHYLFQKLFVIFFTINSFHFLMWRMMTNCINEHSPNET
jgi:hypothetical protein